MSRMALAASALSLSVISSTNRAVIGVSRARAYSLICAPVGDGVRRAAIAAVSASTVVIRSAAEIVSGDGGFALRGESFKQCFGVHIVLHSTPERYDIAARRSRLFS